MSTVIRRAKLFTGYQLADDYTKWVEEESPVILEEKFRVHGDIQRPLLCLLVFYARIGDGAA